MKETEETINQILIKALEVAEKTGEFAIEQAPLLLQEFYAWHTVKYIMGAFFFIIPLIVFVYSVKKVQNKYDEDDLDNFPFLVAAGISGAITIIALAIAIDSIYNLVFITVAPKLYLIEYFTK